MVGIPSYKNASTIGHVVRAAHAGLVQYFPDHRPVLVNADAGSPDGTGRVVIETEPPDYVESILLVRPANKLDRVTLTYPEIDGVGGKGAALRTIFAMAAALDVEALVVVDSDLRSIGPEWIELLAGPILKGGYDFTAPLYSRHKHDGTITNTFTYPLTRALYGLRIRQPIGGDFGMSGDLVRSLLARNDWTPDVSRFGIDIWMTTSAITGGFAVCQARLGAKVHDPKDPGADLGPMFRQVVATTLRLAVAHADDWLDVHGSHDVPAYGFERLADPLPLPVDSVRLLRSFADGAGAHADLWRAKLAGPTADALLGLARLAATDAGDATVANSFRLPDELWTATVYDVLLAAREDPAGIDALTDALAPVYFARVASLVGEAHDMETDEAETLVERQARAFETAKPDLVARWRDGR